MSTPHQTDDPQLRSALAPSTPVWDRRDAIALAIIAVVIAIPLCGLMRDHATPMDEGFMLVFPEQVLHGLVPNRDFLHLYGPASLWVLAAVYKVFGVALATERIFGLVQHIGIILGVYWLGRRWGRAAGLVGALTALFINLSTTGLMALAWNGAVAWGVWGVWALLKARETDETRWKVIAGLLLSMCLLYRPDLILAVGLGVLGAMWGTNWRRLKPLAAGFGLMIVGYVVQMALAGPGHAFKGMVTDPVFTLREGRTLPMPPPWNELAGYFQRAALLRTVGWPFPEMAIPHQLFFWFFLTLLGPLVLIGVARWAWHRDPDRRRTRALLTIGLFGAGMCTQALQRADQTHLSWVSVVTLATVPAAIGELLVLRNPSRPPWRRVRAPITMGLVSFVFLCGIVPQFTVRGYVDESMQTFGHNVFGFPINRGSRNFYLPSPSIQVAAQQLVDRLESEPRKPGEELFVGPTDLRYTPYTDAFFYYLFPELRPSTYFIEMDPFDSKPGTRLASDVNDADWVILTNVWNGWIEPNKSTHAGSNLPNEIIARDFCRVGSWGIIPDNAGNPLPMYQLFHRCKPRKALR
jgi:hypothetical protein